MPPGQHEVRRYLWNPGLPVIDATRRAVRMLNLTKEILHMIDHMLSWLANDATRSLFEMI